MPRTVRTVAGKVGSAPPSSTPAKTALEIFVAVKRAQKEAKDRVLKECGVNRSDWSRIQDVALAEMGQDKERTVGGFRVQVIENQRYLGKMGSPIFTDYNLIVSEER